MITKVHWHGHNQSCFGDAKVVRAGLVGPDSEKMGSYKTPLNGVGRGEDWNMDLFHPTTQRFISRHCSRTFSPRRLLYAAAYFISLFIHTSTGHFIQFDNCLSPNIINSNNPKQLQFVPLFVWAAFNSTATSHNLNVTAYGNVDGVARQVPYPPYTDPSWKDPKNDTGKIPDLAGDEGQQKYTTFTTKFDVLDYTPYDPGAVRFCNTSAIRECPWAPVFNFSGSS